MRLILVLSFLTLSSVFMGCSVSTQKENARTSQDSPLPKTESADVTSPKTRKLEVRERNSKLGSADKKAECLSADTGDKIPLKSQTFPIEFKPFRDSCFVTYHDADKNDPPIGSEIGIFKNGRKIYKFETRYHEDAATCWVEAVSFQDLNADELQDIIVVGKCGAKSGVIQGNEVFINTGEGFYTSVTGNDKLENLKKIKDIAKFVKTNQTEFRPKG